MTTTHQKYTRVFGMDTYVLDISTIHHSVGGTSKIYKVFINGVKDDTFPPKRLSREMKDFFGVK